MSVYNAPILLTYLTNAPLVLPENKDVIAQFKELLSSFVEKAIEKLKINKDTRRTVGVGRVKIMEILSFVMKENVLESREIVASNKGFFSTIIELCKNYQFNNILHNEFLKIINVALSEESGSPLLRSVLFCLLSSWKAILFSTSSWNRLKKMKKSEQDVVPRKTERAILATSSPFAGLFKSTPPRTQKLMASSKVHPLLLQNPSLKMYCKIS